MSAVPMDRTRLPVRRIHLAVVAALVVVAVWAVAEQFRRLPADSIPWGLFENQLDARVYAEGGSLALQHADLYGGNIYGGLPFTYTPFAAFLFMPLSGLSDDQIRWGGTALIFLALIATVFLMLRYLGYRADWRTAAVAIALGAGSVALEPIRSTLWYGQINIVLMLMLVWDLGRPAGSRWKGWSVGVAAGIKLTPAFFVIYLLATRQYREARMALVAGIGTVAIGFAWTPNSSWTYWTGTFIDESRVGAVNSPSNQSLNGLIANIGETADPSRLLWALGALLIAVVGIAVAAWAYRERQQLLAIVITAMTATAISPFSWGHHWVWVVPLIVLALHAAIAAPRWSLSVLAIALGAAAAAMSFIWIFYLPFALPVPGFADFDDFYGIGLYMQPHGGLVRWFFVGAYLWILLGTLAVTAGWLGFRRYRIGSGRPLS